MENNKELFESLLESVTDYIKTNLEILKLKALEKTSDGVSSFIPHTLVFVFVATSFIFLNLGLALFVGELLGNVYFGFIAIGAFYGITGFIVRIFFYKPIKRKVRDSLIKNILK